MRSSCCLFSSRCFSSSLCTQACDSQDFNIFQRGNNLPKGCRLFHRGQLPPALLTNSFHGIWIQLTSLSNRFSSFLLSAALRFSSSLSRCCRSSAAFIWAWKDFLLLGMTRRSVIPLPMVFGRTAWISYQLFFFLLPFQVLNLLPALSSLPRSGLHGFRETRRGQHSFCDTNKVFRCRRSMRMYRQARFVFCTCSWKSQLVHMLMNKSVQVVLCQVEPFMNSHTDRWWLDGSEWQPSSEVNTVQREPFARCIGSKNGQNVERGRKKKKRPVKTYKLFSCCSLWWLKLTEIQTPVRSNWKRSW